MATSSSSNLKVPPLGKPAATTTISAASVARVHTVLSTAAFLSALVVGSALHYKKIVKNGVASYPDEWLPSVSATIGDWFPERNIFQILIALTAAPRFAILLLTYHLNQSSWLLVTGIIRTISCGGWVYITSSDHGLAHDVLMIGYIILNVPWMYGNVKFSKGLEVRKKRTGIAVAFFVTLVPLVYFYIQHKVHRIPGAYSYYAIFEWSLIIFDLYFDSVSEKELSGTGTHVLIGPNSEGSRLTLSQETDRDAVTSKQTSDQALHAASEKALAPSTHTSHDEGTSVKQGCRKSCRSGLSFASDLYLSYVFWSTLTALIPSLFYFSVWELGIAGQELALLSLLSPIFLAVSPLFLPIPNIGALLASRTGQTVAYAVQFLALLGYLSNSPVTRLALVTISCAVMMQREVVLLSGLVLGEGKASGKGVGHWAIVTTLGFIVSSLSKHANHGNNPIWPFIDPKNGGYNTIGLGLAVLALVEFATRDTPAAAPAGAPSKTKLSKSCRSNFLTVSVPLGSLIFSLHNLLADPTSLIAASWTGYENGAPRGPLPHIYGGVTMVVVSLGAVLGVWGVARSSNGKRNPFLSSSWFALGSAGTFGMYKFLNWEGYVSSLLLAVVLVSVAPALFAKAGQASRVVDGEDEGQEGEAVAQASAARVAKTYSGAMFIYILLNLASIFTVAYAFVPGGWIFRERTDAVLTAQLACLAFAFDWSSLVSSPSLAPRAIPRSAGAPVATRKRAYGTLALISIASLATSLYRLPMKPIYPHKPGSRIVNAGIWTVHFGINNIGHDSQRGMRDLIKDMQLDIVGLLETDLHRTAYGHRDLTRIIVEDLGYNVDIGPGPNSHTWGAVLLSKFPIINTTHHLLPSPGGELAPAIEAVIDMYGTLITVVVAHNGQEEDPLDRELQATELARIMKASPYPIIFLGYVVTKPHQPAPHPYQIMVEGGNVHDIDADDNDRWCEYIFYRGLYRTAYVRVSRGIITDTEMQIGQFVVPRHGTTTINDAKDTRYLRAFKHELPEDHWFPQEYFGNNNEGGKNGHFYHVFNTPLYYKFPQDALV